MTSIGETLRRERVKRNLGLDRVSQELKIKPIFLEAIEAERFDELPAGVFAKSFVRQYARLLGLDEEEFAEEVQRILEPPLEAAPEKEEPKPVLPGIALPRLGTALRRVLEREFGAGRGFGWASSLPALAMVVLVILICSGVYTWWQRSSHEISAAEGAPAPTQIARTQAPQPATDRSAPAPEPPGQTGEPNFAERPTPEALGPPPVQEPSLASPVTGSASRSHPAAPAQPPEAAPPVAEANRNASVRVQLTAEETVWVLARTDGKYLFSGTLEPNQSRTVEANRSVLLRVGNAGGVTVLLNGNPIGALGPRGEVRTVQLTSGGFHIVAAPSSSLDPL